MKIFRIKYSVLVWVLLGAVIALAGAGLALNVINLINAVTVNLGAYKVVLYAIAIALTCALLIFALSVVLRSQYTVKNNILTAWFGLAFSRTDIFNIVEITHFKKSNKLVAYLKDGKYFVVFINEDKFDEFILTLRENNKQITYSSKIDGEDIPQ